MAGVSQQEDPDPNPEGLTQDPPPSAVDPEPRPDPGPTGLTQDQDEASLLNSGVEADATDEDHNDPPQFQDQDQDRDRVQDHAEDPTGQSLVPNNQTQDSDRGEQNL